MAATPGERRYPTAWAYFASKGSRLPNMVGGGAGDPCHVIMSATPVEVVYEMTTSGSISS